MSWRDRLIWASEDNKLRKKASFRGAFFFIRDVDRSIGRRNIVHQYPFRDDPYVEDLGRDTDDFTINGYVVQNEDNKQDYIDERDALITALRNPGPGTLIHPFYGEMIVSLMGKARIRESFAQGGAAFFTMTFVKVSDVQKTEEGFQKATQPKSISDYQESVDGSAENTIDLAEDSFGESYSPEDMPGYVSDSIMGAITSLNGMLRSVKGAIQAAFPAQVSKALVYLAKAKAGIDIVKITQACEFANSIGDMFNGLRSILGMYGEILSDELLGSCSSSVYGYYSGPMSGAKVISTDSTDTTGFTNSTMEKSSQLNEYLGKTTVRAILAINRFGEEKGGENPSPYGGELDVVPINTYQRARQSANLVAIVNISITNALVIAAQGAVKIAYSSYDSAIEIMNEVVEEIDEFLLKLGNDSADTSYDNYNITVSDPKTYNGIESLRAIFVEAMKGIGGVLPKPINYKVPPATISTLVLSYDRYYDLSREVEIIGRNISTIKHPGFLPGGKNIEILGL